MLAPGREQQQRHDRERQLRLSTTWLKTSSELAPALPNQAVTMTAGTIATPRVSKARAAGETRMSRKPSMTIWPASVPVTDELSPEQISATPKRALAMPTPRSGDSSR